MPIDFRERNFALSTYNDVSGGARTVATVLCWPRAAEMVAGHIREADKWTKSGLDCVGF
jgi:hypothetical protein